MTESTIIIFGATGNLACTKLFPALYNLFKRDLLNNCAIVGAALQQTTIDQIFAQIKEFTAEDGTAQFTQFRNQCSYVQLNFSELEDFARLAQHVQTIEQKHDGTGNRLLYCATSAQFFDGITRNSALSGLAQRTEENKNPWHRIVYEKPFGFDLISAQTINACIANYFCEHQIYRIDHYLTKELVNNISFMRFANSIFEPLWNNQYIDNVQIILSEEIGIEGRGASYDSSGALKDMVQNHMLELVALIGMEAPASLTGEDIGVQRVKVLEKIAVDDLLLGQYEGYQQEPHVAPDSQTETFAQLQVHINNPRWQGVPFYMKTGKCLDKKESVIHIQFKPIDSLLPEQCPIDANCLTIQLYPQPSISLNFNIKKPALSSEVEPVSMVFLPAGAGKNVMPGAYEVIFQEVLKGERSIAVRFDEIEAAWRIIDALGQTIKTVHRYKKGTEGPEKSFDRLRMHETD